MAGPDIVDNHMISGNASGAALRISLRRIFQHTAEVLRLGTSYLGLAVLVSAVLIASVPPLRGQAQQLHELAVAALQPGGLRMSAAYLDAAYGDGAAGRADGLSGVQPVTTADGLPWPILTEEDLAAAQEGMADVPEHLQFTQVLAKSEQQLNIPGITATQAEALRSYIARKYRVAKSAAGALIATVFTVGREMELDPQLLLAVIAIESRYNPFAESHMGAQGLMQVMTRVHKDKFAALGEGPLAALHPLVNIQVGSKILYDCIKRRGSIDGGLACYVGATGPSDGGYGAKVKAEWRRIALASGIPIEG